MAVLNGTAGANSLRGTTARDTLAGFSGNDWIDGGLAPAGMSLDDLALVAVKSPATMTDNDRAPEDERTVTLKKVEVHAGAGLVHVNLTTSLTTPMPKIV